MMEKHSSWVSEQRDAQDLGLSVKIGHLIDTLCFLYVFVIKLCFN
jgi:hypothetical protein